MLFSIVRFCYIERNHSPTGPRAPHEEERREGLDIPESTYRCHNADVSSGGRGTSGLAGAAPTHHPHTHDDENDGDAAANHWQHARVERTHTLVARARRRRHGALLAVDHAHNVPLFTLRTLKSVRRVMTFDAVYVDGVAFHALFKARVPVRAVRTIRIARDISFFFQHVVPSTVDAVIFTVFRDTYCGGLVARFTYTAHLQQTSTVVVILVVVVVVVVVGVAAVAVAVAVVAAAAAAVVVCVITQKYFGGRERLISLYYRGH